MANAKDERRLVDIIAGEVHENWREMMRAAGFESRKSAWGEELMVPYSRLSARAKTLNRDMVKAVINALGEKL